jgi:hypothetical protein
MCHKICIPTPCIGFLYRESVFFLYDEDSIITTKCERLPSKLCNVKTPTKNMATMIFNTLKPMVSDFIPLTDE